MHPPQLTDQEIYALERPIPNLLVYYSLTSLILGPFFPVLLLPLYLRYITLRYRFDEEGISMRWGIFFRREINLTYARIQDIHLMSNVVERWLGLARIKIQTASGSAQAEMTIEGISASQELRDFLYTRMRGTRAHSNTTATVPTSSAESILDPTAVTELTHTLQQVTFEVRELRQAMNRNRAPLGDPKGGSDNV